jgi:hypothetical protein
MTGSIFAGVYPGIVFNNSDPLQAGRLQVIVPSVPSNTQPLWALPLTPPSSGESASSQAPAVGSSVWVEYEGGNPHYPIWLTAGPGAGSGGSTQSRKPIQWLYAGDYFSRLRRTPLSPAHLFARR